MNNIQNNKFEIKNSNSSNKNNINENIIKNNCQKGYFINKNLWKSSSMLNSIHNIQNLDTNKSLEMRISKDNNKRIKRSTLLIGNKMKKRNQKLIKLYIILFLY